MRGERSLWRVAAGDDVSGVTWKEATRELKHTEHMRVDLPHQESVVSESVQEAGKRKKK